MRPLILGCFWADIWLHTLCAAGLVSSGRGPDAVDTGLQLPGLMMLAVGLGWWEERFVSVLLGACAVDACMYLAAEVHSGGLTSAALDALSLDGPYSVLAVGLVLWRRLAIRRARRLVADDLDRYATAWAAVSAQEGGDLLELRTAVQQIAAARSDAEAPARQMCGGPALDRARTGWLQNLVVLGRRATPGSGGCCGAASGVYGAGEGLPADSLDQLFAQAALLHPVVVAHVRVWAAGSGGMIRCGREGRELMRVGVAAAVGEEQWARVKSVQRAIEKCVRCYGQVGNGAIPISHWMAGMGVTVGSSCPGLAPYTRHTTVTSYRCCSPPAPPSPCQHFF